MTEAEWLACNEPGSMVFALHEIGRERKFRRKFLLVACACFRRSGDPHPDGVRAAETLDRYADEETDFLEVVRLQSELGHLDGPAWPLFSNGIGSNVDFWRGEFGQYHAAWQTASALVSAATSRKPGRPSRAATAAREQIRVELKALVRCVFGNPFQPVEFSPEWRTDTAVALARQMYESRDFSAMPILADALQDAGCDNDDILDHCRDEGPHVRGCWVVDLVLGKE